MTAGEKIYTVRKALGLTLSEVAKHLKLKSTGHLSQIERGIKDPSDSLVELFKKTYSISENWWCLQEGGMFYMESSLLVPPAELTRTLYEHIGEGYGPEVKLMADYLEVKIKGKTAEERLQIVEEIMEQIRNKYK